MSENQPIFPNIRATCCMGEEKNCPCGNEERVIRGYVRGEVTEVMTEEQREYCISTADWSGEGHYNRQELSEMNDKELATALLSAWTMYAQSQY